MMAHKSDVPALDRGLDILELVAVETMVGYSRIIEKTGLPPASAARILKCLCNRGYLEKTSDGGGYALGEAAARMLSGPNSAEILRSIATPILKSIRDRTHQTAILFYWNGLAWECIAKETHENSITMQKVGEVRVDIFNYPWGVFAYEQLKRENRKLVLDMKTEPLEKQWMHYREQGYVITDGTVFQRLAVPLMGSNGNLLGVLAMGVSKEGSESFDYPELIKTGRLQIETDIHRSAL